MSEIKAGKLQSGISLTPANNMVLDASADDGTFTFKREDGSVIFTVDATGKIDMDGSGVYQQDNILGDVSQSGGVPTGAIIESDGGTNGEYVMFADGTLICHKIITFPSSYAAWSPMYVTSSAATWIYPATFSSTPAVSGIPNTGAEAVYAWIVPGTGGIGGAQADLRVMKTTATAGTVTGSAIAVGRWF